MRGSPVFRLLLLAVFLAGAGWLVGRIAGSAAGPPPGKEDSRREVAMADGAGVVVEAYAELQLSAPARHITWAAGEAGDDPVFLDLEPDGLRVEADFPLSLREGLPSARMLVIDWVHRDQSNFLHLVVEPASLETRELTMHFPPGETRRLVDLRWPPDRR